MRLDSWKGAGSGAGSPDSWVQGRRRLGTDLFHLSAPTDHAAMPPAGPRAALLLLSLLLLLRAILTVPLERGAPKEENPATESPVSGVPCSPARCLQWYYNSRAPWLATDAAWSLPAILCRPRALTW